MKCPKCGTDDVNALVLVHGYTWVNLKRNEYDETPDYCDFNDEDVNGAIEYTCDKCLHNWEV